MVNEGNIPSEPPKIPLEPIGEIILGTRDPKAMSREEFDSAPDLLFHGSSKPFTFSRDFDYRSMDYLNIDEGSSLTLGFGFYTTDKENASDYSQVRAQYATGEPKPYITTVLPYQARCLDLRLKTDPTQNAPVPQELVEAWSIYFKNSIQNPHRYDDLEPHMVRNLIHMDEDYAQWLSNAPREQTAILKRLLRTNMFHAPHWMYTFGDYMKSQGYDGLVINEGSEKAKDKLVTAYVFYNLEKIGTYDTWHPETSET